MTRAFAMDRICEGARRRREMSLELHLRRGLDLAPCRAEIEEILAGESEHAGEQGGGHLRNARVVFLNRVVEETAAGGDLVFEVRQLARQLLEVGIGLQVRIGLR